MGPKQHCQQSNSLFSKSHLKTGVEWCILVSTLHPTYQCIVSDWQMGPIHVGLSCWGTLLSSTTSNCSLDCTMSLTCWNNTFCIPSCHLRRMHTSSLSIGVWLTHGRCNLGSNLPYKASMGPKQHCQQNNSLFSKSHFKTGVEWCVLVLTFDPKHQCHVCDWHMGHIHLTLSCLCIWLHPQQQATAQLGLHHEHGLLIQHFLHF